MVLPDIYLLSGFAFQIHQNVYAIAIHEEKRLVLIDCGLDEQDLEQMQYTMRVWGIDEYQISDVFLTHAHFDHAGNAAYFEAQGAVIHAGMLDAESVETGDAHTIGFAYGRKFPVCRQVEKRTDGDLICLQKDSIVRCCHTPGHTPGSMCYEVTHNGRRVLFTGDFVQTGDTDGSAVIGVRVDESYSYEACLASVRRMERTESEALLPGHFRPYLKPACRLIQAAHRELLVNRDKYRS